MIKRLKSETQQFIKQVLKQMGINDLTPENIDTVYDYIVKEYEITFINKNKIQELDKVSEILNDMAQFMDWE